MPIETLAAMPAQFTAGEALIVSLGSSRYLSADGWNLHVAFNGPEQFTLDADGDGVLTIRTADTEDRDGGLYNWSSYVQNAAGQRKFLLTGNVYLRPNPLVRTVSYNAERLQQLRDHIAGRLARGIESHSINGVQITKIPIEKAIALEEKFAARVAAEAQLQLSSGDGEGDRILISFDR